jgi:uncharacterized protein YjbI with pentapeptide repeats
MGEKIRSHIRSNVIGYVALFVALSGTAYATHPGGADTISSEDIIDEEVKAADIDNSAVRTFEILNDSVQGVDILDSTIASADLQNGQVRSADVRNDDLRSEDILDGTIENVDVAFNTLLGDVIRDGTLTGQDVAPDSLTGTQIQESSLEKVPQADNADHLGGLLFNRYLEGCDDGAIKGSALVLAKSNFGTAYTTNGVDSSSVYNCAGGTVEARRVSEGLYRVRFNGLGLLGARMAVGSVTPTSLVGGGADDFVSVGVISPEFGTSTLTFEVHVYDKDGGHEDGHFGLIVP